MRFLDFELKSVLILYWPFLASQSSLSRTKKNYCEWITCLNSKHTHTNALNLALFRFLYLQKRIYCKLFIYYTQPLLVDTLLLFNNIVLLFHLLLFLLHTFFLHKSYKLDNCVILLTFAAEFH